jgi:hypothetical protein
VVKQVESMISGDDDSVNSVTPMMSATRVVLSLELQSSKCIARMKPMCGLLKMATVHHLTAYDTAILLLGFWLTFTIANRILGRRGATATPLQGPASQSLIFGLTRHLMAAENPSVLYEQWAATYGPVFQFPGVLRSKRTVICDPKANAQFYSKETFVYLRAGFIRVFFERLVSCHRACQ